jgi:hypothetical protein
MNTRIPAGLEQRAPQAESLKELSNKEEYNRYVHASLKSCRDLRCFANLASQLAQLVPTSEQQFKVYRSCFEGALAGLQGGGLPLLAQTALQVLADLPPDSQKEAKVAFLYSIWTNPDVNPHQRNLARATLKQLKLYGPERHPQILDLALQAMVEPTRSNSNFDVSLN